MKLLLMLWIFMLSASAIHEALLWLEERRDGK